MCIQVLAISMNIMEVKEKSSVPIGVKGFYVQPSRVFPAGQTEECFKFIYLRFYIFFHPYSLPNKFWGTDTEPGVVLIHHSFNS